MNGYSQFDCIGEYYIDVNGVKVYKHDFYRGMMEDQEATPEEAESFMREVKLNRIM